MTIHLILGGARSGKSRYAEHCVSEFAHQSNKHYIATAIAFDEEMKARIAHHQRSRGDSWTEHECPTELATLLTRFDSGDVVLVDCLTLWLNNIIYNDGVALSENQIQQRVSELVEVLGTTSAQVILVSNEVGLGVVPMGEVSRLFVDNAGWMNQAIAKVAEQVTFVAAGLPMTLKGAKA
ncbi:adenosylcobinamide kinase/adenosylcobinamide-phosphate guanylyltransferase [Vibrio orientalis CIP 102891 = ATCC 33934]|uniref:Bifunctional adenosylcobalamin biosynthesis protein n=1 Tax=Vibrio orientalis CIP 102891 = ATCC 33934 TaxID=675816 RepID=C9QHQ6_VIBOR|nr:bifunctional adenosylcobinamide kinase/adenosylcobinamide-phosphate guanylyltransferase [Vibrio orientalis]EEX92227.1 adenosylcobinamide-phosphate guanylyltransferase [Vibrio orientalis CIP 102891 = ATCC 33934]EGU53262.1 adenosylcobinamide kinase/adenosylcobinamide-phosphate guanylyltransferase [Vibrio orientalis CIP 102891 = ATCC 33934]